MRKQLLALGVIATTLFACGGNSDVYSGTWVGSIMGHMDTVTISKDKDSYTLMHAGQKMNAKMTNDTLVLDMGSGGGKVTFKVIGDSLSVGASGMKYKYGRKK